MAFENFVRQTSTTTGTGNLTVASTETSWRTLADAHGTGSTNTFRYAIRNIGTQPVEYEEGVGYMSDATTMVRATVLKSSNSNNAVNFSAGTKEIVSAATASAFGGMNATDKLALALISEVVTSGSQSTVSFSSIPATYRDLVGVVRARGSVSAATAVLRMRFNGDTGGNYDYVVENRFGATDAIAATFIAVGYILGATSPASAASLTETSVGDYRGTTFHKAVLSRSPVKQANTTGQLFNENQSGWWRSTSAITAVEYSLSSGNFVDGSVVSLYGRL